MKYIKLSSLFMSIALVSIMCTSKTMEQELKRRKQSKQEIVPLTQKELTAQLFKAIRTKNIETVNKILKFAYQGLVDFSATDKEGLTFLDRALENPDENAEIILALLDAFIKMEDRKTIKKTP